jgi:hypothetical protein
VNNYYKPAADITSDGGHKARLAWMAANDVSGISTCPSGQTVLTFNDGRQVFGHANDLLPAHLRPK